MGCHPKARFTRIEILVDNEEVVERINRAHSLLTEMCARANIAPQGYVILKHRKEFVSSPLWKEALALYWEVAIAYKGICCAIAKKYAPPNQVEDYIQELLLESFDIAANFNTLGGLKYSSSLWTWLPQRASRKAGRRKILREDQIIDALYAETPVDLEIEIDKKNRLDRISAAQDRLTSEDALVVDAVRQYGNVFAAAKSCNVSRTKVERILSQVRKWARNGK